MKTPLLLVLSGLLLPSCKPQEPATPPDPPAAAVDPTAAYLGLTEEEASAKAKEAGLPWRVVEVDGASRPVTMDHRPERLNFSLANGKIIRVTRG